MSTSFPHRRPRPLLVLMLACGFAAGCGDGDPTTPPAPVSISLTPATATVDQGGTATLSASVSGTSNTAVNWTSSGGNLAPQGASATFTAPGSAGTFTITATSAADPSKSATATLTVPEVGVSLNAGQTTLLRHERRTISATVTGTVNAGLTWATDCGEIDGSGAQVVLVAPGSAAACRVTAESTASPGRSSSVDLTVLRDLVVNAMGDENDGRCDPEHCTLREAISIALGEAAESEERGIVRIGEGMSGGTIVLESALPTLNRDLLIEGPGAEVLTIDAAGSQGAERRHFLVTGGARVEIRGMTLSGGFASASGGSIQVSGGSDLALVDARISGSSSGASGGGLFLLQSTARLVRVEITGNTATGNGGGAFLQGSRIEVSGSLFAENETSGSGGGLAIAFESEGAVEGTSFEENRAASNGGGVFVGSNSRLEMEGGSVRGNEATSGAGVILAFSDAEFRGVRVEENKAGVFGGGLFATGPGVVRLERLVVARNSAWNGGGGMALASTGDLRVVNTTISGNSAGNGAAIRLTGAADLVSLTIVGNVSSNDSPHLGGAFFRAGSGYEARVTNVLLALNLTAGSSRNCSTAATPTAVTVSMGGNLADDASCTDFLNSSGVPDLNATAAGIDPEPGDNGGATLTHALQAGSPAINAGNPGTCPSTDQRGFSRQGICDIGAFEFGAASAASLPAGALRNPLRFER